MTFLDQNRLSRCGDIFLLCSHRILILIPKLNLLRSERFLIVAIKNGIYDGKTKILNYVPKMGIRSKSIFFQQNVLKKLCLGSVTHQQQIMVLSGLASLCEIPSQHLSTSKNFFFIFFFKFSFFHCVIARLL